MIVAISYIMHTYNASTPPFGPTLPLAIFVDLHLAYQLTFEPWIFERHSQAASFSYA